MVSIQVIQIQFGERVTVDDSIDVFWKANSTSSGGRIVSEKGDWIAAYRLPSSDKPVGVWPDSVEKRVLSDIGGEEGVEKGWTVATSKPGWLVFRYFRLPPSATNSMSPLSACLGESEVACVDDRAKSILQLIESNPSAAMLLLQSMASESNVEQQKQMLKFFRSRSHIDRAAVSPLRLSRDDSSTDLGACAEQHGMTFITVRGSHSGMKNDSRCIRISSLYLASDGTLQKSSNSFCVTSSGTQSSGLALSVFDRRERKLQKAECLFSRVYNTQATEADARALCSDIVTHVLNRQDQKQVAVAIASQGQWMAHAVDNAELHALLCQCGMKSDVLISMQMEYNSQKSILTGYYSSYTTPLAFVGFPGVGGFAAFSPSTASAALSPIPCIVKVGLLVPAIDALDNMNGLFMPVTVFYPQPQLKWSFWWDAMGCKDISLLPEVMEVFNTWPAGSWKGMPCDGRSVHRCCKFIEDHPPPSPLHEPVMHAFCRIAGLCPARKFCSSLPSVCRLTRPAADVAHSPEGRELLFDHGWGALHEAYTLTGENAALMQLVSDDRFICNPLVLSLCVYPLPVSRHIFTQLSEQICSQISDQGHRGSSETTLRISHSVIDACVGAVRRMLVVHSHMTDGHLQLHTLEAALLEMGFESSSPTARVFLRLYQSHGGPAFVQNLIDSGLDAMVVLTKLSAIKDVALVLSGVRALICEVFVLNHRHRMDLPMHIVHAMLRSLGDLCANHGMRLAHLSFFAEDDLHERKQLARRLVEGSNRKDASESDSQHDSRRFSAALRRASLSSICTCCLVVCGTWSGQFERSLAIIQDTSSLTVKLAEGVRVIEGSNFANKVLFLDLVNAIQDSNAIGDIAAGAQAHGAACVIFEMEDNCTWHKQHLMFTKPWVNIPCLGISSDAFKKLKNLFSSDSSTHSRFTIVVSPCMISTSVDSADIRQALQYFREVEGDSPHSNADAASDKCANGSGSPETPLLESLATRCAALLGVQVRRPRGQKGLRILTLDGGGSRGVAVIELLRSLIEALKPLALADVFDVVAGTSTGAIVSCAHFLCGYALDDVSRLYMEMAGQVFKNPGTLMLAKDFARYHHTEGTYMQILESTEMNSPTMKRLRAQSEGQLSRGLTLMDAGLNTHAPAVMVLSTLVSATPPKTFLFRTYVPPSDSAGFLGSAYIGTHDARISEACRASTAAPSYFTRYKHSSCGTHVDGGVLANNPIAIALNETISLAQAGMWGQLPDGPQVEFIVSLGTGITPSMPPSESSRTFYTDILSYSLTDPDRDIGAAALRQRARPRMRGDMFAQRGVYDTSLGPLRALLGQDRLLRLQPCDPCFLTLEEGRKEKLEAMKEVASAYAQKKMPEIRTFFARYGLPGGGGS